MRLRRDLDQLEGYVPGFQPTADNWIKLNTNESPETSPAVLTALRDALDNQLRLYPDPLSSKLRDRIGRRHGLDPNHVIVGNGSDDVLNLLLRVVCDPGDRVVAPAPSYSVYPVLSAIRGCEIVEVPLGEDFALPLRQLASARGKLTFVASPNNPAGTHYPADQIRLLASHCNVLVVDEAYVEFADADRVDLLGECPNLCVVRSFSKAFGLAGLRLGYGLASPELIEPLLRVKDSYNVGRLAQVAGVAALDDAEWAEAHWLGIRERREAFAREIQHRFGLRVYPSHANFVLVDCAPHDAAALQRRLEKRRILVRRFGADDRTANALRISIGSAAEMDAVLDALGQELPAATAAVARNA